MELVRVVALSFADDGKRVKVPTFGSKLYNPVSFNVFIDLFGLSAVRFVFKGLWEKGH